MKQPRSDIVIDIELIQSFKSSDCENASAFLVELIDCYLKESSQQVQAMRSAVSQGNVDKLRCEAHILKSSSAAIGANKIAKLCKESEAVSSTDVVKSALQKVLQIEVDYQKVKAALSIERQRNQI